MYPRGLLVRVARPCANHDAAGGLLSKSNLGVLDGGARADRLVRKYEINRGAADPALQPARYEAWTDAVRLQRLLGVSALPECLRFRESSLLHPEQIILRTELI